MGNNTVTITRDEFVKLATEAVLKGEFMAKLEQENPKVAFTFMLSTIPLVREIEAKLFGKEESEDGKQ